MTDKWKLLRAAEYARRARDIIEIAGQEITRDGYQHQSQGGKTMITRSALIDMDSHLQKVEEAIVQAKLHMISCDDKRPPVYKYNDDMRICAGNFLHLIREAERELEMYRHYLEETKKE